MYHAREAANSGTYDLRPLRYIYCVRGASVCVCARCYAGARVHACPHTPVHPSHLSPVVKLFFYFLDFQMECMYLAYLVQAPLALAEE